MRKVIRVSVRRARISWRLMMLSLSDESTSNIDARDVASRAFGRNGRRIPSWPDIVPAETARCDSQRRSSSSRGSRRRSSRAAGGSTTSALLARADLWRRIE